MTAVWLSGTAFAQEQSAPTTAEQTATAVHNAVGRENRSVERLSAAGNQFTASIGGTTVSVGRAPGSPVVLNAGTNSALKLRLPNAGSASAVATNDGTIVYQDSKSSTSVQVLAAGEVRATVTMNESTAPKQYAFGIELPKGAVLRSDQSDGSVDIVSTDGSALLGTVKAPWAKDASGRSLPTRYTVSGDTIVQSVDATGAKYPVVADPDVTYNCGWTSCNATFSRFYTANVLQPTVSGAGGAGAGILAGALMCGKIPSPPFAAACAAAVAITYGTALLEINSAKAKHQCFTVRFNYIGAINPVQAISYGVDSDSNCKNS